MTHSSLKKGSNSRNEPILYVDITDNLAKNQFKMISLDTLLLSTYRKRKEKKEMTRKPLKEFRLC